MTADITEQAEQAEQARGRARREWLLSGAWALLGLVLLALSAAVGSLITGQIADEEAFLRAQPCAGAREVPGTEEDCLRTIRATVRSAQDAKSGSRGADVFRITLRAPVPAPADQPFDLTSNGDLAQLVEPGEEVEVTTWRNVQVSVRQDGVTETLPGLPDEATMYVGLTLIAVWTTGLVFIAAFGSARRARCHATGRPVTPRVGFGLAKALPIVVVPLAVSFFSLTMWDAWTAAGMAVAIWALIAFPATFAALRWDRDR
ncbi:MULTISPECIES: hypothetical protein [Streptomyces]|uniref:Integral membrane protein n=1 Tax=Streptomyces spororaveus TaxID=284039 RepID=A0ABQ3TP64_9ACTN|nr:MULTISPECIES: hypothetical protein [Streptomyces]MCM9077469.1 hypothetical protein [Streptomyces spororaveus]MCX5308056.1 hypothetical protein [Streptomyces sp. NBC_00160]GHI82203.1 hypothetical protein Sspor_77640 [Streptomyces spororaveus]